MDILINDRNNKINNKQRLPEQTLGRELDTDAPKHQILDIRY